MKNNLILMAMLLCLSLTVHAQSKLIDAIKLGDLSAAQNAVSKGDDVNANFNGVTPMSQAYFCPEVTKWLIEQGADANSGDYPALVSASNNYSFEVMELLLNAGADPNKLGVADPSAFWQKKIDDEKAKGKKGNAAMISAWEGMVKTMEKTEAHTVYVTVQQTNCVPCLKLLYDHGAKPDDVLGGNPFHTLATFSASKEERKERFAAGKDWGKSLGINIPKWYGNLGDDRNGTAGEMIAILAANNVDINKKNDAKFTPFDLAEKGLEATEKGKQSKREVVDALYALMNPTATMSGNAAITASIAATSDLAKDTRDPSKVKAKADWPQEGRNSKSGGGWSVNPELLEKMPKRVALVTFYLEDPGTGDKTTTKTTVWATNDYNADKHVAGFYDNGIEALVKAFSKYDMDLLLPEQFLDTEEKKTFYNDFQVQHGRLKQSKDKIKIFGLQLDRYRATAAGFKTIPIANEKVNYYGSLYNFLMDSNESAFFQSMGYDLTNGLGVDAVAVVCIVTRKIKKDKEDYALNHTSLYMFGPNPIQLEEDDKLTYVRGQFYCGARVNYSKPLYFQKSGKKGTDGAVYIGMDNILTSLTDKIGTYFQKNMEQ